MRIELIHAPDKETIAVPDRNLIAVLKPNDCCPFHDTDAALKQAVTACAEFLGDSQRVLVLVNDYTRPTPNAPILAALRPVLSTRDFRALVCLGTHRPPTEAEYATIFGSEFLNSSLATRNSSLLCHDSKDKSRLFFLGKTSFGTDVWLNQELLWADKVVTINSIEPHYFAGYTGGRKGFLPGIAGYDTVTQNHNMVTREGSMPFGLKGNPVHEDMAEAARMLPRPVFSIQLTQDRLHNLLSIRFGDLFKSFDEAVADAHQTFAIPVTDKADIVLSVLGPPSNINFYQAQRAVEFARPVLKNPAVHITVSSCYDGIGNDSFIRVFHAAKSPSDLLPSTHHSSLLTPPSSPLGWHKSARLAQIMQTADLYTVMGIDDKVVKSVFMHPYKTAQTALDAAFARLGQGARVYVIPDAGYLVPVLP
ncbi:MAG TPA: nickel-dependent lactate racemase [bacterium]|nr:nickel-dependent lactate racemase [bacterium]